jgi:hypothetical protein
MRIDRSGTLRKAAALAGHARRTSGRLLFCGAGFATAYYLDTQNGHARRAQLRETVRHAAQRARARAYDADVVGSPDLVAPPPGPPPVFSPPRPSRGVRADDPGRPAPQRTGPPGAAADAGLAR